MNWTGTALPEGGAEHFGAVRFAAGKLVLDSPRSGGKSAAGGAPTEPSPATGSSRTGQPLQQQAHARAEQKLVARVFDLCHGAIVAACKSSSVPPEFLGALTANESGGNNGAVRFEPTVYRHLTAVVLGDSPAYGSIRAQALLEKLGNVLHPKADDFHAHFLSVPFGANHRGELTSLPDEGLRELATSWGYTQIMGYHMVERRATVRDLLDPGTHYRVALELLAEFAAAYQLDLSSEFAEMFCCWNTGQPYAKTYDPHYVSNGLARMAEYKRVKDAEG